MRKFILAAVLIAATVPMVNAQNLPPGKWWTRPEIVSRLGISGEQQRRLEIVSRDAGKQLIDLKGEMEKRTIDLRAELDSEQLDRGRIQHAAAALSEARARLFERELMMMVDMRNVLTAEQWNQLRARITSRMEQRDEQRPGQRPGQRRDMPNGRPRRP